MKSLSDFPRIPLGIFPTPLRKLEKLSKLLGINLFIKRDDMTGISLGGNKVRKLEFLLADAKAKGCDTIITTGGAQSNHAMLTAACCKKLGLEPRLVLKKRGVCEKKGNLLLESIMNVNVSFVDSDSYDDVYAEIDKLAAKLEKEGHKPYIVPVGGSVPIGTLGYVDCAKELYYQTAKLGINVNRIVTTAGSGGTMAGMVLGTKFYSPKTKVTGIAVSDDPFDKEVADLVNKTAEMLGSDTRVKYTEIEVYNYFGDGYAIPSKEGNAAIKIMAESEGLFLDPVYTGKTFAGLLDLCKKNVIFPGETVIFMHTGGAASLFALDCL